MAPPPRPVRSRYVPALVIQDPANPPGRRYLRFFRFIDTFFKARDCILTTSGLDLLLGAGKWGFLGSYLFLESLTIVSPSPQSMNRADKSM